MRVRYVQYISPYNLGRLLMLRTPSGATPVFGVTPQLYHKWLFDRRSEPLEHDQVGQPLINLSGVHHCSAIVIGGIRSDPLFRDVKAISVLFVSIHRQNFKQITKKIGGLQ
jgi:hypothetical protein